MKSDRLSRSQREETKLVREKADKHLHWHNRIFQEMTALGNSETESEGGPVSWRIGWKLPEQFSLRIPFQTEAKGRVTLPHSGVSPSCYFRLIEARHSWRPNSLLKTSLQAPSLLSSQDTGSQILTLHQAEKWTFPKYLAIPPGKTDLKLSLARMPNK